jgi:hypothetical protein
MIRHGRFAATLQDGFAVFLIGMRINRPLLIHKWLPVVRAMPRMLAELYRHPELGFIHAEMWPSRTIVMVQYWRSVEQLLAYAKNKEAEHLPAWRSFNRAVGANGSVGLWHETYLTSPGTYENVYVNMPPFGLGKAGVLAPVGARNSATDRLKGASAGPPAGE